MNIMTSNNSMNQEVTLPMSSIPKFEIPLTPGLSSSHRSDSSNDDRLFFSPLFASNFLATDLHKDAGAPLPKERLRSDAGPVLPKVGKNTTLRLDKFVLRDLPPLDTDLVDSERTTSLMSAILPDSSQVHMPNGRSQGVIRRASDKGPASNTEREKSVSMSSLPSTPFSRQDLSPGASNPLRSRTIKFVSPWSPKRQFRRPQSPHPRCLTIHANTDALARLAWTGEFLSPSNDVLWNIDHAFYRPPTKLERQGSWRSTWSSPDGESDEIGASPLDLKSESSSPIALDSPRPILLPRCPSAGRCRRRRWTLALAITDDELTDEALVDELEKLRRRNRMWEWEWEWHRYPKFPSTVPYEDFTHRLSLTSQDGNTRHQPAQRQPRLPPLSDVPLNSRWRAARHALLICRELVRTERHYLSCLRTLQSKDTLTAPSPLMISYLPALIQSSEAFVSKLEQNPSAKGVADAFVTVQVSMEQALVSWCGVVGSFFEVTDHSNHDGGVDLKKRVGSWGKKMKSLGSHSYSVHKTASEDTTHGKYKPKPRVRDLAILPSQRIVRYVLLYKDLLAHTPSPLVSHKVVVQALQSAIAIAQKCDRAQENSFFLFPSSQERPIYLHAA